MYWYRKHLLLLAAFVVLTGIYSCNNPAPSAAGQFFDLKGYFTAEASRLHKLNPSINKKVVYNKSTQTTAVHIADWQTELSVFSESDINKPAWRRSYTSSNAEGITTYAATDTNLRTRFVIVKKQGNKVRVILIFNEVKQKLFGKWVYHTTEELSYVPDSMYSIHKRQYLRTQGLNNYYIKGLFDQR